MMNIGIDTMGGDFAPVEALRGIKKYLSASENNNVRLFLFGDADRLKRLIAEEAIPGEKLVLVTTSQVIGMQEHPTKALKEKTDSSIAVGFQHLAKQQTDAFISAGNTGAMLVGAAFTLKPVEGIIRPVISSVIPKQNGGTGIILDVGLNADCKPEQLNQFATLGTIYARHILEITDPKVGLINVGEEEGKGNLLTQSTYPLLKENKNINFVGNIEGRDVFNEKADVMVCDGFTGNVILKLAESLFDIAQTENIRNRYLDRFNFEIYGGTPVLGIEKPVIVGHGISKASAFANMIHVAEKMLQTNVLQKLKEAVQ